MRTLSPSIEPLESRIAPAVVFTPTSYSDSTVDPKTHATVHFVDTNAPGADPTDIAIANQVGHNANSYFIKLTAGEDLRVMTNVGFTDIINVTKGTVVAFFTDPGGAANANSTAFQTLFPNELTGIALGTKLSVAVGTDVHGDIVTNYNDATGILGASSDAAGSATSLLPNLVPSLNVAGDVTGSLVVGANLSHFTSGGNLHQILTGTAANGYTFNFNGNSPTPGGSETLAVTALKGVAGPSLSNATIGSTDSGAALVGGIHLGDGGAGAAGGSVTNLTILNDTDGFTIQAGAGGNGTAAKSSGGAGGSLNTIVVQGPIPNTTDPTPNSVLEFIAGVGGDGFAKGKSGAGGKVQQIYVDFNSAKVSDAAPSTLADNVLVQGGNGGNGASGGAGGGLNNIHILTSTPHDTTPGAVEFQLLAGNGGTASAGKAGAGGSVTSSSVSDVDALTINSLPDDTLANSPTKTVTEVLGGTGGVSASGGGGAGGAISTMTFQGFGFQILSGSGGDGTSSAGAGGAINSLNFLGSPVGNVASGIDIHVQDLVISTGVGGDASAGKGAASGSINGVSVSNADFGDPQLMNGGLQMYTGDGGMAAKGAGGAAGSISNVNITDIDFSTVAHPNGNTGHVNISTGVGGDGTTAGGAGGALTNFSLVGTRLDAFNGIETGMGGTGGINALSGKGGAGGAITNVSVRISEELVSSTATGVASNTLTDSNVDFLAMGVNPGDTVQDLTNTANNFNAAGNPVPVTSEIVSVTQHQLTLSSDISSSFTNGDNYIVAPQAEVIAGTGGDGLLKGAGGAGGSIVLSSVAAPGMVNLTAGQGGSGGTTGAAGAGGSLKGLVNGDGAFSSISSASLIAGDAGASGGKAGAGGSISQGVIQAFSDITFMGGSGTQGGAGGGISTSSFSGSFNGGFVPSSGNILLQAGTGGSATAKTGGVGGSISQVTGYISDGLFDNLGASGTFTTQLEAGGGADGITKGGTGGSINSVNIFAGGGPNVLFYMDAGDAGNATSAKTGAVGGSITNITAGTEASTSAHPSIDPNTNFHHLSAGNGGDTALANGKGGLGGSVSNVHVNTAIGLRTGANFGFDLAGMGGISAGAGGAGGLASGLAGNVTAINADAIASIVAGHLVQGDALNLGNLVTKVDGIILNGTVAPVLTAGAFDPVQFSTANLVGGIANLSAANPAAFKFTNNVGTAAFDFGDSPTDGLIAALSLTSNKNFVPEAFVTADASGLAVLVDNLNS